MTKTEIADFLVRLDSEKEELFEQGTGMNITLIESGKVMNSCIGTPNEMLTMLIYNILKLYAETEDTTIYQFMKYISGLVIETYNESIL